MDIVPVFPPSQLSPVANKITDADGMSKRTRKSGQ